MTTAPNFRARCAELVELLEDEWSGVSYQPKALNRARADLATPPPEPPTDEELVTFLYVIDPEDELSPLAMVRAALERWGHG